MSSLGNKEIMAKNIQRYMDLKGKDRKEICNDLNFKYSTFSEWVSGNKYPRIDKIEIMANYFGINKADLVESPSLNQKSRSSSVPNLIEIIRNDSYTLAGRTPTPADRAYLSNMVDTYIDESSDQTIAAHRTDSPSADLPEEALQSIEEFKNFVRAKYKKD